MAKTFYFVNASHHPDYDEAKIMRKRYEASIMRELPSGVWVTVGLSTKPVGAQKPYALSMNEYSEACVSMMV